MTGCPQAGVNPGPYQGMLGTASPCKEQDHWLLDSMSDVHVDHQIQVCAIKFGEGQRDKVEAITCELTHEQAGSV